MGTVERAAAAPIGGFAVVAVALAGLAIAFLPWVERLDNALLDAQWSALRRFDVRPAPKDIVIVGLDEASARAIAAPQGMWHEALGLALARIASAGPRAIGVDIALPERSYDAVRPGVDRALLVGLAAARRSAPLVATLSIDARTRGARPVFAPYLAVLGEESLGIGLLAADIDGVTRRFSLAIPTEEGSFPTLSGRLCRALAQPCSDGLIHFALGAPHAYIPLQRVLDTPDADLLGKLFRDRIVLVGEVSRYANRIEVPANYAGWEGPAADSPAIVVHAQSLRTALQQSAPREASRVPVAVLVTLAALLALVRDPRHGFVWGVLAAAAMLSATTFALRAGLYLPVGGALLTLALAWAARAAWSVSRRFELRRKG